MADPAILAVSGLRKAFAGRKGGPPHVAVDDVSFALAKGGALSIVGESGSGKTTIARCVIGLERADAGTISACGNDRSSPARGGALRRQRAREVQVVFQDPYSSLDRRQPVDRCLDEVLRLHFRWSAQRRRERLDELAELMGLTARQRAATPAHLSGGQRQRVAIARALASEPQVLILDEPMAALDVSIQAQIINLLVDIRAATRISYLLISHDLAVVRQLTDDAVVLRAGRIVEQGPTEQILDAPATAYTRLLRDSVPRPRWRPSRRPQPAGDPS